jgi:mono/diheme cytochrome c family protein
MRTSLLLLALGGAAFAADLPPEQRDFFESKVRPILAGHCYSCHSIEEKKSKGDLTLDTRQGWQKGGASGQVIVPGKPEESLLITAIGYQDADLQMPPKGEKLSDEQIATLTAWVKMGAPDPRDGGKDIAAKLSGLTDQAKAHWAYQPVKKPAVPENKQAAWAKTPVDAFILQKLEANGMTPNKPATKEALIRRAYYDLIGLPPTPYEVADFLKDTAPNAFEKVITKLLASPHYGERWGRHWLDTARYSDTIGGERNNNRTTEYRYAHAWTYRDYVVKAFNEDKPYDQFIREQLAADLLPDVKKDDPRLAALGFLTVGERFRNVNDIINDRIDTVSKGFLGLTVACARCHDHMFDPIPTRDYYALHGVFSSVYEPDDKPMLPTALKAEQLADFQEKYTQLSKELQRRYLDTVDEYLGDFFKKPEAYLEAALTAQRNRQRPNAESEKRRNQLIRDEKLDDQFVQYLGRAVLKNPAVFGPLAQIARTGSFQVSDLQRMSEMGERAQRKLGDKKAAKMGDMAERMAAMMREKAAQGPNKYVADALTKTPPTNLTDAIKVYGELFRSLKPQAKGFIAAMKSATSATVPGYDHDLIDVLRGPFTVEPAPLLTKDTIEAEQMTWPNRISGKARLNFSELNVLELTHPGSPAKAMVVADRPQPKNSPVFIRGEAQSRGPVVPRGFLEILSPGHKPVPFSQGSGRLELAEAIASKDNPLTARVAVNRIWMHHFGEGLVPTPDDLGVQAGAPSHPELLDYLAAKFVEFGWSMKQMHKLIMLSAVYQQSTETNPAYETKDPDNRLLWRANIRRLDFEAMRDSLLVFSGQLDRSLGGKPINLTDEPYSYRRSVYGYIDRGNLPELMQHFDFSDPDMPNSKRTTTVVPQQALFLMNSAMAVDIARKLIARPELAKTPDPDEKVRWLYRIMFQRLPRPDELQLARNFLAQVQSHTGESPDPSDQGIASEQERKRRFARLQAQQQQQKRRDMSKFGPIQNEGERVERRPLTGWEAYAQALLFSNEIAYVN